MEFNSEEVPRPQTEPVIASHEPPPMQCVVTFGMVTAASEPTSQAPDSRTTAGSYIRSQSRKHTQPCVPSLSNVPRPTPTTPNWRYDGSRATRMLSPSLENRRLQAVAHARTSVAAIILHVAALSILLSAIPRVYALHLAVHIPLLAMYCSVWVPWLLNIDKWFTASALSDPLSHIVCLDAAFCTGLTIVTTITWHFRRTAEENVLTSRKPVQSFSDIFDATNRCWTTPLGCISNAHSWSGTPYVYATLAVLFATWMIWFLLAHVRYNIRPLGYIFSLSGSSLTLAAMSATISIQGHWVLQVYTGCNLLYCVVMFMVPRFYLRVPWDLIGLVAFFVVTTSAVAVVHIVGKSGPMTSQVILALGVLPVIASNSIMWLSARGVLGECAGLCLPSTAADQQRRAHLTAAKCNSGGQYDVSPPPTPFPYSPNDP